MNKYQKGLDFQTPPDVAGYMARLVPDWAKTVLEPTPGKGNIVLALQRRGFEVTAPDDYFLLQQGKWDCVVANPPFSSKYAILDNAPCDYTKHGMRLGYEILKQLMEMSDNVICLMPWFTISDSDVRLRYLKDYGIKSITALPRRTFQYARVQTMVLQLERGFAGSTVFKVYDKLNPVPELFTKLNLTI